MFVAWKKNTIVKAKKIKKVFDFLELFSESNTLKYIDFKQLLFSLVSS